MLDSPDSAAKGGWHLSGKGASHLLRCSSLIAARRCSSARNVYFQFGHKADLFQNSAFKTMFFNAIRWASER